MSKKDFLELAGFALIAYALYWLYQKNVALQAQQNATQKAVTGLTSSSISLPTTTSSGSDTTSTPTPTSGTTSGSTTGSGSFDPSAYYQSLLDS